MKIRDKVSLILNCYKSWGYIAKYSKPNVMNDYETVVYMLNNRCSICRYGDGELELMLGIDLYFQNADEKLRSNLIEIARNKQENLLVCIPEFVGSKKKMKQTLTKKSYRYWKRNMMIMCGYWYKFFDSDKKYGDSMISRFYIGKKDKKDRIEYVTLLKKLFAERNILFVEGETSRLGVGNDLFGSMNERRIRRIICPSTNAYARYNDILSAVMKNAFSDDMIICALGPTATVLCSDLCKEGFQALDLGHIDSEYDLFKREAVLPPSEEDMNDKFRMISEYDKDELERYDKQVIVRIS